MTIQSINAYTPSRPAAPRLDRTWATKKEVQQLQEQIDELKEIIKGINEDRDNHGHSLGSQK